MGTPQKGYRDYKNRSGGVGWDSLYWHDQIPFLGSIGTNFTQILTNDNSVELDSKLK